jgi:hypothetical protein
MHLLRTAAAAACIAWWAASAFAGQALEAMRGHWSPGSCDSAGEWRVFGNEIEFAWPGRPVDVERVVSESGSTVETIGISPEIKGNRFTYLISRDGNSVLIRDHRAGADQVVRRCRGATI